MNKFKQGDIVKLTSLNYTFRKSSGPDHMYETVTIGNIYTVKYAYGEKIALCESKCENQAINGSGHWLWHQFDFELCSSLFFNNNLLFDQGNVVAEIKNDSVTIFDSSYITQD